MRGESHKLGWRVTLCYGDERTHVMGRRATERRRSNCQWCEPCALDGGGNEVASLTVPGRTAEAEEIEHQSSCLIGHGEKALVCSRLDAAPPPSVCPAFKAAGRSRQAAS